jgi:ATP-binding cassette subfamily F protein 3
MELEKLDSGNIEIGHNVSINYFSQKQSEELNNEKDVIDEIYDEVSNYTLTQVRSLLGAFLFQGKKVFQKVSSLSGGEKSRLALAKMLLKNCNFLILYQFT